MARQSEHEKYREALTALALGADGPADVRREPDLLAHAAECDACREEYAHAQRVRQFLDSGVARLVFPEPSPGFDLRLRGRLAQAAGQAQARRGTGWPRLRWRWIAVGGFAFALAALLLALVARDWRPRPSSDLRQAAIAVPNSPRSRGPSLAASSRSSGVSRRASRVAPHSSLVSRPPTVASAKAGTPRRGVRQREPEVLVPPGQLEALEELAAALASGEIDPKAFAAAQARFEADANRPIIIAPIEIKPIEIKPIAIPQVDTNAAAGDPASAPGAPQDSPARGAPLRSGLHWIGIAP